MATIATPTFQNPVLDQLADVIVKGINAIAEANEKFYSESKGTPVREIRAAIKEKLEADELGEELKEAAIKFAAAEARVKEMRVALDNMYRTQVLGEDAQADNEVTDEQKAEFKELHANVKKMVEMLVTFASLNKVDEAKVWAESLEIPRFASKSTSSAGSTGIKRARVYVTVDDTLYDSFTLANQALKVPSGTLQAAWADNNEAERFIFNDHVVEVVAKSAKSSDDD